MDLVCRLDIVGTTPVLELQGEIDLATVPTLQDALARALLNHPTGELLVDLDGVTVLDDVGLGVLMGAAGRAREGGRELVLVCSVERLLDRLDRTGISRTITIRPRITP